MCLHRSVTSLQSTCLFNARQRELIADLPHICIPTSCPPGEKSEIKWQWRGEKKERKECFSTPRSLLHPPTNLTMMMFLYPQTFSKDSSSFCSVIYFSSTLHVLALDLFKCDIHSNLTVPLREEDGQKSGVEEKCPLNSTRKVFFLFSSIYLLIFAPFPKIR